MKNLKKEGSEWFPTIDKSKCIKCLACVKFCRHDVYAEKDGFPKVINPQNCVIGCKACDKVCPTGAISHPSDKVLEKIRKAKSSCTCGAGGEPGCGPECDCGTDYEKEEWAA